MTIRPLKILIIRFSSIGDIVLTTPVVRCLRKKFPDASIHYLTKVKFKSVIGSNPNIDTFHFLKGDLNRTIATLKKENFDYVIDLHHNMRSWMVKRSIHAKSFSFKKLNLEKWLLVNLKIDRLPRIHIVDRYFETLAQLGVTNDNEGLEFYINAVDEVERRKLPEAFSNGYVVIVMGGTYFTKRLPNEKIISLCHKIDKPIMLLGGETEMANAFLIAKSFSNSKIYNAVNKYGIAQSSSLIKQADIVITNDTGMMHIAAAFKKRIISVWGNTIPEFGMTPYYGRPTLAEENSTIVQVQNLSCRPCSKLGYDSCPKKHFKCMMDIDETIILDVVNKTQ